MGLTNAQVCERLGIKLSTCKSLWWQYRNIDKVKKYQANYYKNNKKKILARNKKWYKDNKGYCKERAKEYWYQYKCKMEGVAYA